MFACTDRSLIDAPQPPQLCSAADGLSVCTNSLSIFFPRRSVSSSSILSHKNSAAAEAIESLNLSVEIRARHRCIDRANLAIKDILATRSNSEMRGDEYTVYSSVFVWCVDDSEKWSQSLIIMMSTRERARAFVHIQIDKEICRINGWLVNYVKHARMAHTPIT